MTVFVGWLRKSRSDRDEGFSLAELLSTMVIMGVLTTIVSTMFIASLKATQSNSGRVDQQNWGRTSMESMSRVIRSAVLPSSLASCVTTCDANLYAFISGDATSMSFYADIDNASNAVGPSQVTLKLDPVTGVLTQTTQPPDPNTAATGYTWTACTYQAVGCSKRIKLLAQGVQSPAAAPYLFTYYSFGSTTPINGALTSAQLQSVDAVDIYLQIKLKSSGKASTSTFVQRVSLPNVDTVIQSTTSPSP